MVDHPILVLLAVVLAMALGSGLLARLAQRMARARLRSDGGASEAPSVALEFALPSASRERGELLLSTRIAAPALSPPADVTVTLDLGTPPPRRSIDAALRVALDLSPAASAVLDAQGRWLYANEAMLALLACADRSELASLTPRSLAIDESQLLGALLELESRNEVSLDTDVRGVDGRRVRCRTWIRRHVEQGQTLFLLAALDLDALREALVDSAAAAIDATHDRALATTPAAAVVPPPEPAADEFGHATDGETAAGEPATAAGVPPETASRDAAEAEDAAAFLERRLPALAGSVRDALERGDIGAAIREVGAVAHEALSRGAEVCAGDLDRIRVDLENGRLEAPEEIELLLVTALPALRAALAARPRASASRAAA